AKLNPSPCIHPNPQDPEVQKHATQILRNMLRQEEAELQAYSRHPAAAVEEQIEGARRRVSQLQLKILQETGASAHLGIWGHPGPGWSEGSAGMQEGVQEVEVHPGAELRNGFGSQEFIPFLPDRLSPLLLPFQCDSLFQDLSKLKSRPAHLGVFLRYIFSQADPSPLLFYLCADVCQQTSPKDSRGLAKDIWNIFLDRNAVRTVSGWEDSLALQGISWKPSA
ncbi:ARHGB factor, partial [Centropus bengalensis]|nr:ARHGB factor [Centropus bengalensis]